LVFGNVKDVSAIVGPNATTAIDKSAAAGINRFLSRSGSFGNGTPHE
jgi:hypothetical protein